MTDTQRAETMSARGRQRLTVLGLPIIALVSVPAIAAEWDFQPSVTLGQSYTGNVALAEDGAEEAEWITELRPGVVVSVEGPKFTADLDYEMQILQFDDNSDNDEVFNRLDAAGNVELLPESAFLDAFVRYDQQNVDTEGRLAFSNFFTTDNRTNYSVIGLSPYHVGSWGGRAESLVRITAYDVEYSDTDAGAIPPEDSENLEVVATIGSPESAPGISWRARGSHIETDFQSGEDFEYDQARFELGVPVGARTRLIGEVGQESDVEEDSTQGGLDESVWFIGFNWAPSDLQSIEIRAGDRFYGSAWEAAWRRRGSRGELTVDYTETPTTSTGVLGDDELFLPGFPTIDIGSLDTRPFLQKRLAGRASYQLARSVVAARIYSERREFLDAAGGDEDSAGLTLSFDWDAAARTTVGATLNLEEREFGPGRKDEYLEFNARVRRQVNRILAAELRASHLLRNTSSGAIDEYDANLVSLFLIAEFGDQEDESR